MTTLRDLNPIAAEQWDYELNGVMTPDNVAGKSEKKAHFICSNNPNHKWQTKVAYRTNKDGKNVDCPYCSKRKPFKGETDIFTLCPEIKELWDFKKNNNLNPYDITYGSEIVANFICTKGHSFNKKISEFIKHPTCPICYNRRNGTLLEVNPTIALEWDYDNNTEFLLDTISVKSTKTAHFICIKNPKHTWKRRIDFCTNNDGSNKGCPYCNKIKAFPGETDLLTVCPESINAWDYDRNSLLNPTEQLPNSTIRANFKCSNGHYYSRQIKSFVKNPTCPYCSGREQHSVKENCYDVIDYWDYDKNGKNTPEIISLGSSIKIYFKCKGNPKHTWYGKIRDFMTVDGNFKGCPYCNGVRAFPGETDLLTVSNMARKYWNFNKNPKLDPSKLLPGSGKKANFRCDQGHEFVRPINVFLQSSGCPDCYSEHTAKTLAETNSLAASQWDYEKNGDITPDTVSGTSKTEAYFICKNNPKHKWKTKIINLSKSTSKGGCPYCSGKRVLTGDNDLFTKSPNAKLFWDYNNKIDPRKTSYASYNEVNFICPEGHEFKRKIYDFYRYSDCPICKGRQVIPDKTSLKALYPDLVNKEWNYFLNALLGTPDNINPMSSSYYFWTCSNCGKNFNSSTRNRVKSYTRNKTTCPYCSGNRIRFKNY